MTPSMGIESAGTDTALRKINQFLVRHISDISSRAMGTVELREQIDPDAVALHIRDGKTTVAAINSHAPAGFALGLAQAAKSPDDVEAAFQLASTTKLLEHLAVAPSHRNRGYARALVEEAEREHRSTGKTQVWFGFVDDRERESLTVYAHLGFTIAAGPSELPGAAAIIAKADYVSRSGTWFFKSL